ncbi:SGNH/GDSL hydrolase family protein [Actinocrinis puniceicyclus]|uniref:SGNH/GDSL hydrolase family protein n=1 Tax=Actinocrinis puniceicyclus TaxID=977794 RepID=A0A8J8BCP5_9ACTN|nr:SGNH/GDSL hydrolase family protein [Actinocrinis puniceicyclus]MBS2964403.1 SGNH/GDSL hydrolase family protein [Actinocrinis puniceicyclus]
MNPLLLPVIAAQGIWVRRRTEVLPHAAGPTTGTVGDQRDGRPLRIAVLGESTAAGCGVDTHDEGFTGSLARELSERSGRPVAWEVVGQYGATGRRVRHRLLPRLGGDFDLAVLLAGANDVLARRAPREWREDLCAIVDDLAVRCGQVVVVGLPPFAVFPSLPGTLRAYLAARAAVLDGVSRQVCAQRPRATFLTSTDAMAVAADFFARDGFHPSAYGYQRWAQMVADGLPA